MSAQRGYPSQQKLERTPIQFVTVEPVHKEQNGASVVAHQFVYQVGTDAAEAGSTVGKIVATGHAALEGDVILMTSGSQSGKEIKVVSVSANEINLAEDLPSAIGAGDAFSILRHKYPSVSSDGAVNVNAVINEVAVAADGGALPALTKVVSGYDGTNIQVLKTDAAGELQVDVLSSALPAGAATETTLGAIKTAVELIDDAISGSEMQVDVVSSALPAGAATETTLLAVKTAVETIDNAISGNEMQVDVVTSALPLGAATSAAQTDGTQKTQIVDGTGEIVEVKALNVALAGTDKGLITHSVIHGQTTGGGGGYVDVKVTPSGALVTETTLSGFDAAVLGQEPMATSLPVVIASDQTAIPASQSGTWNINNISGAITLPTGAATETTLSALNGKVPANLTVSSTRLLVDGSGVTQPISATALPLPLGAATETTLGAINTKIPSLGQATMAASMPVVIASNQSSLPVVQAGRSIVTRARNVYSSVNVTTGAYVQLVASLGAAVNEVEIFDSSGETLVLATGGAGSEVDQAFVFPGGNGRIPLAIAAATRVSIKAVSATANSGEIAINFYS